MKTFDLRKEKLPENRSGIYCIIHKNGDKIYYKDDKWHRDGDLPALEYVDGYKAYYKEDKVHRTIGPAVIFPDGSKKYWLNDIYYPDIKTDEEWLSFQATLKNTDTSMKTYDLSKEKFPENPSGIYCIIYQSGNKFYYKDDKIHRDGDLPAIERTNGTKRYYKENKLHRTAGPAIIWSNGDKQYWLNDICYQDIKTDEEWLTFQATQVLAKLQSNKKETKMSRAKKIGVEIAKRSAIDEVVNVGKCAVLELLSFFGVRKNSKFYKFFASDFANNVVKAGIGLFLAYCPFTQDEKYQSIADELLTQSGVASMKEAINILLAFLSPQAVKFAGMITSLTETNVRVNADSSSSTAIRVNDAKKEDEEVDEVDEPVAVVGKTQAA